MWPFGKKERGAKAKYVEVVRPERATSHADDTYEMVSVHLDQDTEAVAAALLEPHLLKTIPTLDKIDLSTMEGQGAVISNAMLRIGKASFEKDEVIAFVERNRAQIPAWLNLMEPFAVALTEQFTGKDIDRDSEQAAENLRIMLGYLLENVRLAYEGRQSEMDMRSDKLFWLIFAAGSQLSSRIITYERALQLLSKPSHRDRISRHQLIFMLQDFATSVQTPTGQRVEHLLLIGECGRIASIPEAVAAVSSIIVGKPSFEHPKHVSHFLDGAIPVVRSAAYLKDDVRSQLLSDLALTKARLEPIQPSDF